MLHCTFWICKLETLSQMRQLERVTLVLPDIGKGGPGLRKNLISETELDECRYVVFLG